MIMNAAISPDAAAQSSNGFHREAGDLASMPHSVARQCPTRWRYRIAVFILGVALLVALSDRGGYTATLRDFMGGVSLIGAGASAICFVVVTFIVALQAYEQRVSIARLADEIERQRVQGVMGALPAGESPAVARLANAINRARRQQSERLAELLDVQTAYAHDLRMPLTRMGIRCESLEDSAARDALTRDLAEMNELVDASLACARLQYSAGKQWRGVDADGLMDRLVCNYLDAGRSVAVDGRVGQPVVTCPHALRRVLANLIDNALRYSSDVRVSVKVEARRVVFSVSDSGPGIEPSEMEAVFGPWYRAPRTDARASGTGIGLAIARRMTLAMRGEFQVMNLRAGGLEARLSLPLVAA